MPESNWMNRYRNDPEFRRIAKLRISYSNFKRAQRARMLLFSKLGQKCMCKLEKCWHKGKCKLINTQIFYIINKSHILCPNCYAMKQQLNYALTRKPVRRKPKLVRLK